MKYRSLGTTGLNVSEVGFGAWAVGGNKYGNSYGPTDDIESRAAIHRAIELGCNFFDTADVYGLGHSEELLGEVLAECGEEVIVATKVGSNFYQPHTAMDFSAAYLQFAVEQSLTRLRREYIDICQLHNPPLELIEQGEVFQVMESLREQGKIRFYGVAVSTLEEGLAVVKNGRSQIVQVVYNIFNQSAVAELFPRTGQAGIGIIAREPLFSGFLTGKFSPSSTFPPGDIRYNWPRQYVAALSETVKTLSFLEIPGKRTMAQAAIRFVLDNDAVSVVIPGAKNIAQVEENMMVSEMDALSAGEISRLAVFRK